MARVFKKRISSSEAKWGFLQTSVSELDLFPQKKFTISCNGMSHKSTLNKAGRINCKKIMKSMNIRPGDMVTLTEEKPGQYLAAKE